LTDIYFAPFFHRIYYYKIFYLLNLILSILSSLFGYGFNAAALLTVNYKSFLIVVLLLVQVA